MGICFSEASRCSDVSSLPKNNKSLRCILYLKNFFIDDNIVNFMQFCEARHKPGAGLYDEEE